MNYNELKTSIAEVIRTNGNEEITGEVMQYILLEMVSSLGKDFQFAGVGTPSTQVDEPDENKAWILGAGHYTNFGAAFDVAENQIAVAMYNGSFDVRFISVGRPVDATITENGQNPVEGGAIFAQFEQLRAAGYLFAGIVTKATIPPAERPEKIFYLCTQGGVYTNFDNLNLLRGLNVILWNGTQWQGNNVFLITDEITTGSDALPTAGAVFEGLDGKVDKEEGKGLSQADFTNTEKSKLGALPTAADLAEMLGLKQDVLTWDSVPTEGSEHAIYSGAVYEAIKNFITKAVDDLINYYTKSQTYTKTEIDALIGAIKQFRIISVPELPQASADTMGAIYLVPAEDAGTQNVKDEYITLMVSDGGYTSYSWEKIGTTEIDLSNYPTFEQMNAAIAEALASYYTKAQVDALIAAAVGSVAELSLVAEPKVILTNTTVAINLTGRAQVAAESLTITRGGYQVATGSGKVIMAIDNVNIQTAGTVTYLLTAVIGGVERTQEFTIDVVDAVYYGAGTQATDITTKATARKTPAGRYTMVAAQGDNFFVLVPSGMSIQGMRINGLDLPVESPTGVVVDDKSYLCYKSSNAYEAGTYVIEVY